MSVKRIDLTNFKETHTLEFRLPDGAIWFVPPFDEATELAFWDWRDQVFGQREQEQKEAMGIAEPDEKPIKSIHQIWGPLLLACVKQPKLSEDDLKVVSGPLLRTIGGAIVDFFLTDELNAKLTVMEESSDPSVS